MTFISVKFIAKSQTHQAHKTIPSLLKKLRHLKLSNLSICLALTLIVPSVSIVKAESASEQHQSQKKSKKNSHHLQQAKKRKQLFIKLKHAASEAEARQIEYDIWQHWLRDTDITSRTLVMDAMEIRSTPHFDHAMELLNTAIKRTPDYAEAWNQRAFMHFLNNDYVASLKDIEKALALEPKHFGALAGKARILMKQGRYSDMQAVLKRALEIHPWLKERKLLDPENLGQPL